MPTETDAKPIVPQSVGVEESSPFMTQAISLNKRDRKFSVQSDSDNTTEDVQRQIDFKERQHLELDRFEYRRNGNDPGLVLIFNQVKCQDFPPRTGTTRDVNELILCFQRQGYNIYKDDILEDYTTSEIKNKLEKVSNMDLSAQNCLILFFLTHGDSNSILYTKDSTIQINTILQYVSSNKHLAGKPKIFIFQACKGANYSKTGTEINTESLSPLVPSEMLFGHTKIGQDMLIVHSSLEDHKSFRNTGYGTWFIQELCKVFSAYGKRDDILGLLMRVSKNVAGNYYHKEHGEYLKQMPVFISTLTKKFYLNRNKDRDLLLRIDAELEEIHKEIKEIKDDIKKMLPKEEKKKSSS